MVISLAVAFPVGILSATHRNSPIDGFGTMFALFGICMPNFLIALLLIYLFGVTLRWLPISGYVSRKMAASSAPIRSLTLPAITLGLALAAVVTRTLRSSLLETLYEDYVRTARAKGLAEQLVIRRHALKNGLIPVVTILGLQLGVADRRGRHHRVHLRAAGGRAAGGERDLLARLPAGAGRHPADRDRLRAQQPARRHRLRLA